MTTRRLIVAMGASAGALALAAVLVVRSFPLEAQGRPQGSTGRPVEIVKGGEHLLHAELPEYPKRAIEQRIEGDVTLDLAIDDRGEVADARVLNGPDELRKAALESVLGWHYSPTSLRSASTQATLRFNLAAANALEANATYRGMAFLVRRDQPGELTDAQRLERKMAELQEIMPDPNLSPSQRDEYKKKAAELKEQMAHIRAEREAVEGGEKREGSEGPLHLVAFKTERVSADAAGEVLKRSGLKIGDAMTEDALKNLRAAATAVDEHFRVNMHDDGRGGVTVVLVSE